MSAAGTVRQQAEYTMLRAAALQSAVYARCRRVAMIALINLSLLRYASDAYVLAK